MSLRKNEASLFQRETKRVTAANVSFCTANQMKAWRLMQLFHKNFDPLLFMCCRIRQQRSEVKSWGVVRVVTGWGQCEVTSVWGIPDYSCPSEEEASKTSSTWSLGCQSDVQQKAIDAEGAREWREFVEGEKKMHSHTCAHMHNARTRI